MIYLLTRWYSPSSLPQAREVSESATTFKNEAIELRKQKACQARKITIVVVIVLLAIAAIVACVVVIQLRNSGGNNHHNNSSDASPGDLMLNASV